MSKRAVLVAIALVSVGIVFGAVLVSSFSGASLSFADSNPAFRSDVPFTPSADAASLNETFSNVSDIVTPQVVYIAVKTRAQNPHQFFWPFQRPEQEEDDERYSTGTGSGIILTADGYILTNRHVIENAVEEGITVKLNDNREFDARLIGEDANTDIAVVKIDAENLTPASLGNSDDIRVGEWVLAVGNPLGWTSTVTAGIVSAISRNIGILRDRDGFGIENFIQTDAAINPGNSGGALVNLQGQVIGVNTAIAGSMQGTYLGFAVPINLAKVVANALIRDGKFVRGYIGVRITDIDAKKAEALGMDVFKGVLVESLVEDGAGKAAGIQVGDAIVEVDGKPVESANQLQARVGMKHPGESVALRIWRDGKYITKSVTLKGQDGEESVASVEDKADEKKDEIMEPVNFEQAGFVVKPLTSQIRSRFDRKTGVYIDQVKRNGKAAEAGLRPGVVLFEAIRKGERTPINSVSDFKAFAKALGKDESVLLRVQREDGETMFVPMKAPIE
ncbi:MAG: trypsin-like peptidase domain-containing protein [Bacteroidetes bacterium]|nr:trypsin-like peptidase domain-containing protein [Bacteroidota bacterium]